MQIIPAIDLIDGKCVRLIEGDFNKVTEYQIDPIDQAMVFKEMGATRIHLVDLDGARNGSGKSKNRRIIKEIKKKTRLTVQTGGGIRNEEDIKDLIYSGIDHLIIGTALVEKLTMLERLMADYGEYLLAGIDVKNNSVKIKGWESGDNLNPIELGKKIFQLGFKTAIYTDICMDGKLAGPNIEATKNFSAATGLRTILSGGVSTIDDIEKGCTLRPYGLVGIIVGKAYYEGKIDLKKAIHDFKDK